LSNILKIERIMKRIQEHTFELNGEQYHLSFFEKPILKKNGVNQKVKPILKEYITKKNLPIQLINKNGNEDVPWTLAKKILEYFSKNSTIDSEKVSSVVEENKNYSNKIPQKNVVNNIPVNESCNNIINNLNWEKIQDKSAKKLLIISCSDKKKPGGVNIFLKDYFNNQNLYNNLIIDRNIRREQYNQLFIDEPNYFIYKKDKQQRRIKRDNIPVSKTYFSDCRFNNFFMPAFERYAGKFYSPELRNLYFKKNRQSNLHILIISGFYGVIEFRDSIIDYHLEINKQTFWTKKNNNSILEAVKKYIEVNEISNDMVFYSLSDKYRNALDINPQWKNLWIKVDHGDTSARCLEQDFLPRL